MKKIDLQLNFSAIRQRIENQKMHYKPGVWADMVGVSKSVVSNVHGTTKQNPSLEYIIAVSRATGRSVDHYLWGDPSEQNNRKDSEPPDSATQKIITDHQNLIKKFEDPVQGIDVNQKLIDLQNTNRSLFKSAIQSIVGYWDAAMEIKASKLGNYSAPGSATSQKEDRRKEQRPKRLKGQENEKNGTNDQ